MDKWSGKVALVTGASSGIGEATADRLARNGMKVILTSNEPPELEEIVSKWRQGKVESSGKKQAIVCDLTKEHDILQLFRNIDKQYGGLHVCVNCAGLSHVAPLLSGSTADWKNMFDVNVMGLCICSREAVKLMDKGEADIGHIININSISGHKVIPIPEMHFYTATKYAVTAVTEGLRHELRMRGSKIRVTGISPGSVKSNFSEKMFKNSPDRLPEIRQSNRLEPNHIADTIIHVLSAPGQVSVNEVVVNHTQPAIY